MNRMFVSLVAGVAFSFAGPSARADVPPPDSCQNAGSSCNTAGPAYNQPGTCVSSTCTRATPDGSVQYPCARCVTGAGGGSGSGGGTGAGGGSGAGGGATAAGGSGTAGTGTSDKSDDGGCSCSLSRRSTVPGLLLVSLGIGSLLVRRRRS